MRLWSSLEAAGFACATLVLPAGEKTKSFEHLMTARQGSRSPHRAQRFVIALGGGVIGDLTGFAAGIVRRGVRFVQMPTSLLSQVDSSVGGKTGINSRHGKNLIGVFHQPDLVLADTDVLNTLSEREFRAGYAEVAKYGLIDKPDFFAWLEANWRDPSSPAAPPASRRLPQAVRQRPTSSSPTSARTASVRSSISAIPSATRWKLPPPMTAPGWSTARAFRSAWFWPMNFRPA
jgi:3-dehydroquinate synthetase